MSYLKMDVADFVATDFGFRAILAASAVFMYGMVFLGG